MKKILALIMTLSIFVLSGCSSQTDRMVTDREGTEVNIPTKIEKIISTAPSNTEVLMALGLGDKLVAIDKYSTEYRRYKYRITTNRFFKSRCRNYNRFRTRYCYSIRTQQNWFCRRSV